MITYLIETKAKSQVTNASVKVVVEESAYIGFRR